ncbi:MAG TPA: VWA domain-containing protein [Candidatus Angelobacter sp.]|nr:VWA domain-containing protein [Candidatus Angelobacter sp.]
MYDLWGKTAALTFVVFVALFKAASAQPGQEPTLRTQTNLVQVPVLVKDKDGRLVYGLQAKDFIVEDDGVEQPLRLDEEPEPAPISLVIVLQLGRTAQAELPRIRSLGTMLQPILSDGRNRAAIVTFDSQIEVKQPFTTNGALIAADISRLTSGDHGAVIRDAVAYSAAILRREPPERQRVLLLVSETRDHGSHVVSVEETVRAITDGNILVYTLAFSPVLSEVLDNMRGDSGKGHPVAPLDATRQDEIVRGEVLPDGSERGAIPLQRLVVMAAQALRKNSPRSIAAMTGGEYELFKSHAGFEARMMEFTNHLRNRYLLSFEPKDPRPGLHEIRVRLRQPGKASVLARNRYWAHPVTAGP